MTDQDLTTKISETLDDAGIYVAVSQSGRVITLAGEVDSDESRQAALDVAHAIARPAGLSVTDQLEVQTFQPDSAFEDEGEAAGDFQFSDPMANPDAVADPEMEIDTDFTEELGTTDARVSAEEGVSFFPPTDPVVRPTNDEEEIEIVGGFQGTSMDDDATGPTTAPRNDDDIAEDVRRELVEDALTTDLGLEVAVRDGLVMLRGSVPTVEDVENAEAVASRVPGIVEVREEIRVEPVIREENRGRANG